MLEGHYRNLRHHFFVYFRIRFSYICKKPVFRPYSKFSFLTHILATIRDKYLKISGKLRINVVYKYTKGFVDRTSASSSIAIFSVFSNLHRKNSHRFILNAMFMIFGTKFVHSGVQTLKLLSFFLCLVCKSILRIL